MFAQFCRPAAGLTDSGGWSDLGIRSLGSSLIPATQSLHDLELGPLLSGATVYTKEAELLELISSGPRRRTWGLPCV